MAITTSDLGSNSTKMTIGAGETQAALIAAIESYITAHGWTVWDSSAGTNARAYRAVNKDGSTYKYIVIDVNSAGYVLIKVYEAWNETLNQLFTGAAHTGLNLASSSDSTSLCQRVDLTNGSILYIFSLARYLVMQSNLSGTIGSTSGNSWTGVFEHTRDMPSDTVAAGYPAHIWLSGYLFCESNSGVGSFCRTRNGLTGGNASTRFGYVARGILGGCQIGSLAGVVGHSNFPTLANPISLKNCALSLHCHIGAAASLTNPDFAGKIYGLKLTVKNSGTLEDTTTIKADSDFFETPLGNDTDFTYIISANATTARFLMPK